MTPLKNLYLVKSLKLSKSKPSLLGLMILFDFLMIVLGFILFQFSSVFAGSLYLPQNITALFVYIGLTLLYILLVLFIYSFFKFSILRTIGSFFGKTDKSYSRLGKFYTLNLLLLGIFSSEYILINFLLFSSKASYKVIILFIIGIPMLAFSYVLLGISHSLFYQGNGVKNSISKSFKITFTNLRIYKETVFVMLIAVILYTILLYLIGYVIQISTAKNYFAYLTAYSYFQKIAFVFSVILLYFFLLKNQIVVYMFSKENDLPKH